MKKTKIICTMGPNTNDREILKKLVTTDENKFTEKCKRRAGTSYCDASGYQGTGDQNRSVKG